jgi:hypothetical protein
MKRRQPVLFLALLFAGLAESPGQTWAMPMPRFPVRHFHHFHHFHHDRFPVHHFHHDRFFFGFGVGALVTAPFWYPGHAYPVYAAPAYPAPVYPAPPPTYWYYCQNPPGYYPHVAQCPGGWLTVVPPVQ